uniref:CASP-like protein n=1 Tax=Angiostrongylus cantonensis TaxID=6313 RepID=A0A0K0D2M8_ANGCA
MCVERSVATMRSSKYESKGVFLGLFLFALTVVGAVATASFVYDIDDFGVNVYSMVVVPPSAVSKFNMIAVVLVSVSLFCMITFLALSRFNKKLCSM